MNDWSDYVPYEFEFAANVCFRLNYLVRHELISSINAFQ